MLETIDDVLFVESFARFQVLMNIASGSLGHLNAYEAPCCVIDRDYIVVS